MRADRLLTLMLLLQTRGKMTTHRLADELGVSRRTILRDVDALSFAGVPVYAEGGHGGGIALDENYRTRLAALHGSEVGTLFVSSNTQLLGEVGLGEASRSTLLKLLASLPASHQPSVAHIRQRLLIDPAWWWRESQPPPFWDRLQQAVYEDRCIQAVYERSNGERVERALEPYSLVAKSSIWYLIAQREGAFRTYRVSRFHQIDLLETHFRRQDDFDLQTYWKEHLQEFVETLSEYRFTLRIHPDRVNFAKWLMPGRCRLDQPPSADGWVTAHFHVETMDLARMLVFGLGRQAVVVDPPALQEAVLSAAHEILGDRTDPAN